MRKRAAVLCGAAVVLAGSLTAAPAEAGTPRAPETFHAAKPAWKKCGTDDFPTLQCASVVGRVFWDEAVSALAGDEDVTKEALDDARSRELVFRRDHTSFENAGEYLFKHALLCDVTYETVLLRDRPMLHARAAELLESAAGERMVEYREMIAGHLRAAGEPERAAEHL